MVDEIIRNLEEVTTESYELIVVPESIVKNEIEMDKLTNELNINKMEGFHIYPVCTVGTSNYIYYDYPNKLVLCVVVGYWG